MSTTLDPGVIQQAAEWFLLLQEPEATATDHEACIRWRASHADHEAAWQRALWVSQRFGQVPLAYARPVLGRRRLARREVLKSLMIAAGVAGLGGLGYRQAASQYWLADYRTVTGEQANHMLDDGSRLYLDTASAVDVRYDARCRRVRLWRGAVLVEVAQAGAGGAGGARARGASPVPDDATRPFVVESDDGCVRTQAGRFSLRQEAGGSLLRVYAGQVEVWANGGTRALAALTAGQALSFAGGKVGAPSPAARHTDAWTRGVLHVERMRLGDFVAELQRYRPGVLTCDPAVADLPLTGSYQLAQTTAVLDSLSQVLPVRVRYLTRYWVSLLPA
ncbi:FecR family protein [Pseudomonas alcaligenes]|uniref:FecR domain-containing protein n=1 Tax=Pseudomonas sp. RIT-PI-AD TaxID=3035294 RepID=UPI0021D8DD09